jgi:hypothetical protein
VREHGLLQERGGAIFSTEDDDCMRQGAGATLRPVKTWRLAFLSLLMLPLGQIAASALHEFGHAGATLALGGRVLRIQPWYFRGLPHGEAGGLSTSRAVIVLLAPLVSVTGLGMLLLVKLPWTRLRPQAAVLVAAFLLPLITNCWPWAFAPLVTTPVADQFQFDLMTKSDGLPEGFIGQALLWGGVWFWFRRTRILARWREARIERAADGRSG